MSSRSSYAPGWGPARVKDARLKGWEPLECVAPLGSTAEVLSIEPREVGSGEQLEPGLYVVARVRTPDGATYIWDALLRRPSKVVVRDMRELGAYLDQIAGDVGLDAFAAEIEPHAFGETPRLRYADGPPLSPLQFLQAVDAVRIWRMLGVGDTSPGEITVDRTQLEMALDAAFLAGLRTAEAEVKTWQQRKRALKEARRRSAAAQKWWPAGIAWAQDLIDSWPSEERFSLAALAAKMWEGWRQGPLDPVTARLTSRQLETVILPQWRDAGAIQLP